MRADGNTKVLINSRCCYHSKSIPLQNKWDFYFRTVAQRKCFLIRWNLESMVLQRTLEEHVLGWISALIAIISKLNHWTFILHLFCFIITLLSIACAVYQLSFFLIISFTPLLHVLTLDLYSFGLNSVLIDTVGVSCNE